MSEKHYRLRDEDWEAELSMEDLYLRWRSEMSQNQVHLKGESMIGELVDIIRGANLRAQLAREFQQQDWKQSWYRLKYEAIVKALEMRSEGVQGIKVALWESFDEENEDLRWKVDVEFDTHPRPYRTGTSFLNLAYLTTSERVLALIGEPDQFRQLTRSPKPYHFSGKIPRTTT